MRNSVYDCRFGRFFGRRTFQNLVYVFQDFCGIVGSLPRILGMKIRACKNQCRIVGSEDFLVGRLFKIWSMHFKISVVL